MIVKETKDKKVRTYNIVGPRRDTVESFWNSLVEAEIVDSYEIEEEK